MTYGRVMAQYRKTEVETAGRMDLVLMCYDQAIHSLRQAKTFYETGAFEDKGRALKRALDIIHELRGALDLERGGQIAGNLDALYAYLGDRLLRGDLARDLTAFDEGAHILNTLKGAWQDIAQGEAGSWAGHASNGDLARPDRARAAA
jgi:flagellar protein FliS